MEDIFIRLLNVSITASYLVIAVLVLRLIFKKAPKWLFCVLWALVGLRLVFPVSFESALSLIPSAETVPSTIIYQQSPHITSGIPIVNQVVNPVISETFAPDPAASANPLQIVTILASWVWALGLVVMLVYTLISYLRLRHRVSTATLLSGNIFQSEVVQSPFVLGIIKPKIYLPYSIGDKDIGHVIAHEKAHLKRKDHLIKPLAFLILSVYWFNPLMWVAYVLLCRDIELACDEKVIRELDTDARRCYSTALLNCSVNRRMIAACPLAFGEVGVKERVKSVMNYKRPAFWIILLAVVVCIVTTVCFMTNPESDTDISGRVFIGSQIKYNYVKNHGISGIQYCITDDMVLYRFSGDNPGVVRLGKLEKSDVTAEELTSQIEGQERGTNNPTYTFNSLKAAYVTEKKSDPEETVRHYVAIDEKGAVLLITMHDYLTMNDVDYISNVEQIEVVDGADYRNTFSSLIIRITKADYMGTSQVLESVQTYYWAFDEKGGSMELTDGLVCSTKGFDMSEGKIEISLNKNLVLDIGYDKEAEVKSFDFALGEKATLRTADISGETTYYSFDFIQENDIKYADNLVQKAVYTDYNGVNAYLSDNSSLDGNIGYTLENRTDKGIEYGEEYVIYRITDGKAVKCDAVSDIAWDAMLYVQSNQSTEYTSFRTDVYDISQPGLYRFEKTFNFSGEKEEYKLSFDFEITETEESKETDNLDKAISKAILEDNKPKYYDFATECVAEGHIVYGTEVNGNEYTVYMLTEYNAFGFENGYFMSKAGGCVPAVMTFEKTSESYNLLDIEYPLDGAGYAPSIKKMFPEKYRNLVTNPTSSEYESLWNQCVAYAQAYLDEIGRDEEIRNYSQVEHTLLTDVGVSVEVSNKILEYKIPYNYDLGYYESVENEVRYIYRTSYDKEQNKVVFTKEIYDTEEVVEKIEVDSLTGDIISD